MQGFGSEAQAQYNAATAAQKKYADSLLKQIDTLGKSRAERIAYNAQLKLSGSLGDELASKALAQEAAMAGVAATTNAASHAMEEFSLNNSFARRELGRLVSDMARGNFGRFEQTSLTLANASGLLGKVFSPAGAAIAAFTATIGIFAVAALKGQEQSLAFEKALAAAGGAASLSAGQLKDAADAIGHSTGDFGSANKAVLALA